jgi:PAS domain S-box-containing protein
MVNSVGCRQSFAASLAVAAGALALHLVLCRRKAARHPDEARKKLPDHQTAMPERAERELQQSGPEFRQLAEALPQLVWTCRPDGTDEYLNRQWCDYTGTTLEEVNAGLFTEVVHPDDYKPTLEKWSRSLATGEPFETEYRLRRASDGEYRWFLARALPLRNGDGEIVRWVGACTDIHDLTLPPGGDR